MASPYVQACDLRLISPDEALALVDAELGPAHEWPSELLKYRMTAEFQEGWKSEVGQWLAFARDNGFLPNLRDRIVKRARRRSSSIDRDPNDQRHVDLLAELAPATVSYYLGRTGWSFTGWEPITGGPVDVDVSLSPATGTTGSFQCKAPDVPGRVVNHRRVEGEYDDRIVQALTKGVGQLNGAPAGPPRSCRSARTAHGPYAAPPSVSSRIPSARRSTTGIAG